MKAGVLRIRLFRPFPPTDEVVNAIKDVKAVAVIDRHCRQVIRMRACV